MGLTLFPGIRNLVPYEASNLSGDLTAGVVVTFLLLPQSMAYAMIAGVPLSMGLLAGTFPLMVYALFGSSPYLSVGPVSATSLLAFSGISKIAAPGSASFLELMILIVLLAGVVQLIMGVLRFGSMLSHLSPAVISGFISALAIIIILNQVNSLLGLALPKYENLFTFMPAIFHQLAAVDFPTAFIGFGSFLVLVFLKRKLHVSTGPFITLILAILLVDFLNLDKLGVEIVGPISFDNNGIAFHVPSTSLLLSILPIVLTISFMSFLESYSVATTLAEKENQKINPNQELIGLGFANITSSVIGSIPVAGAISRTAVNHQAGAKTKLSLFITALLMLLAIFYLTPLFYYLPKAALAAIIIYAVWNLIHAKQFIYYLKYAPFQAIIFILTFAVALSIHIIAGLVVGIGLSLFAGNGEGSGRGDRSTVPNRRDG